MPVTADRMQAYDHSIGDVHEPERGVRPLTYNIFMMRLGRITLGTRKWWNYLFDHMHLLGYEEIERVCAGRRIPAFISQRLNPQHKAWINSRKNNSDAKRIGKAPTHGSRVTKALNVLRDAPPTQLGFATVVTDFAGSEADAIRQAETSAANLSSFVRRRFDHGVCVLFPEVDQKFARNVDSALIPRAGWKVVYDPDQRIHKIHFHGLIYVPGHSPSDVEKAFRTNKNGKRNRSYSGANQVRVIPVDEAPGYDDGTPDIEGVAGYSTKYHYRPPVMARMLEGFVSWLVVTDAVINNPKTTVVVGVRKGSKVHCDTCETYHSISDECDCPSILTPIPLGEFYGDQQAISETASDDSCDVFHADSQPVVPLFTKEIILNSVRLSYCKGFPKEVRKKFNKQIKSALIWGHPLLQNFLIPRGP